MKVFNRSNTYKKLIWKLMLFGMSFLYSNLSVGQEIEKSRTTNWANAGANISISKKVKRINMSQLGVHAKGKISNSSVLKKIFQKYKGQSLHLLFPEGQFLFEHTLQVPSYVTITGKGADKTIFRFHLKGGHSFLIKGTFDKKEVIQISKGIQKGETKIYVEKTSGLKKGDWIQVLFDDSKIITSSWAKNTVGQIVQIKAIKNQEIVVSSALRLAYPLRTTPFIRRIKPAQQVGIEKLKIERIDNTAPRHSSNIAIKNAVNCWVHNVNSHRCTYSHIEISRSSNIEVKNSFFKDGFEYGKGGRAYGIVVQLTSNECLIENNKFEHLRHALILQAGANANVFTFNHSVEAYWKHLFKNAAGDVVLHGNYPYLNLFEQNICQNIVIDNSHGMNGPYNTFYRNRAERYGIFFSTNNSPSQNIIANEVTKKSWPIRFFNYRIKGEDHLLYGNLVRKKIRPKGTKNISHTSCFYRKRPGFIAEDKWLEIGTP